MNQPFMRSKRVVSWRKALLAAIASGAVLSGCANESSPRDTETTRTTRQALHRITGGVHTLLDMAVGAVGVDISINQAETMINGTPVTVTRYRDLNAAEEILPLSERRGFVVNQLVVDAGEPVIISFRNHLAEDCGGMTCDSSIHPHGIELDNDSDGTGVTQNAVKPGEHYTYRFIAPRPGVFWFHPHMKPAEQVFSGAYGALIVRDPREQDLIEAGVLPGEDDTHTIVLADTDFDAAGKIGMRVPLSPVEGQEQIFGTWAEVLTDCVNLREGRPSANLCGNNGDGAVIMVNGQSTEDHIPEIRAAAGTGVRLRLLNAATHRYFRLAVRGNGSDNNLYRVGGEGGLLERVRLEGGMQGSLDTGYDKGEILLPASARADVVVIPRGSHGDVITITGVAPNRGPRHRNPAGDVVRIVVDNSLSGTPMALSEGDPILGDGSIEDMSEISMVDSYIAPVPALGGPGSGEGSSSPILTLRGIGPGAPTIDGHIGHLESSEGDYLLVPYGGATRYARVGDVLEFTILNATMQHHPFHHHGFSFQPLKIVAADDPNNVLHTYDHREFQDVVDVPQDTAVVVRMRLEDRPRMTDLRPGGPAAGEFFASGGAAGRWVFHCHLFSHAALGMISELVVLDTDRDADGFDTSVDCDDFDPTIPTDVEICNDGADNDCDGNVDEPTCNSMPEAFAGPDQALECAQPGGAWLSLSAGASDPDGDSLSVEWQAQGVIFESTTSGATNAFFPVGTTTVTLVVSDGWQSAEDQMQVTVVDTTPPDLAISLTPGVLSPPNRSFVDVAALVEVSDVCDPAVQTTLLSIENDQFVSTSPGDLDPDVAGAEVGTPDFSFQLRAALDPGSETRTYSVTYVATDAADNHSTGVAQVFVPRAGGGGTPPAPPGTEPPGAEPPSTPPQEEPPGTDPPGAAPPAGDPPGSDPPGPGRGRP